VLEAGQLRHVLLARKKNLRGSSLAGCKLEEIPLVLLAAMKARADCAIPGAGRAPRQGPGKSWVGRLAAALGADGDQLRGSINLKRA